MSAQDILIIFSILGIFMITGCVVYVTYYLVQAIKSFTNLADNLDNTTQGIKDKLQMRALAAIPALMVALVGRIIKKRRG